MNASRILLRQPRGALSSARKDRPPAMSLDHALRYLRAAEITRPASYELHVRLRTAKGAPPVRGSLRLPKSVKPAQRICVIARGEEARKAKEAGALLVGAEDVVKRMQAGELEFDKCLATPETVSLLTPLARVLGQKGLMPSVKRGTVTTDIANAVEEAIGRTDFREHMGVVRLCIGKTEFNEAEVYANIEAILQGIRNAAATIKATKVDIGIDEVVLSSSHGPGLVLQM